MNFQIIPYQEKDCTSWNQFLKSSSNGVFLFERGYMDYHKDRFQDASIFINKGDKIRAIFPANLNENCVFSHQGLTFGGLIFDIDFKAHEAIHVLDLIKKYYSEKKVEKIIYKTTPYIFHSYPAQEDLYALFRSHAQLYRRDVFSIIDLANPIRFSETKRQSVRKCNEAGIQVKESTDFSRYWNLLEDVLLKFNAKPTHSLTEISLLQSKFPGQIKLYEAIKGDYLLAGIVIYDYGNVIHTQYMANSSEGRKLGVLDFINHKLINEVYRDRPYYSFGTSNENEGQSLNEGLIQQKELMGGRSVAHDFYKIDLI